MECYRPAMIDEPTFESRRETQANKLSRTFAMQLEALNRHRGKGRQKGDGGARSRPFRRQAVVGVVGVLGSGDRTKLGDQP
jgi:hypothetical protein